MSWANRSTICSCEIRAIHGIIIYIYSNVYIYTQYNVLYIIKSDMQFVYIYNVFYIYNVCILYNVYITCKYIHICISCMYIYNMYV